MIWDNSRLNCKGKLHTDIVDLDYQHYYRDNYNNCVNWVTYRNVWKDITKELINEMVINNYEWKFPCGLGSLGIKKYKKKLRIKDGKLNTKNLQIDFKETELLWKEDSDARDKKIKIYYNNKHTDGYKVVYFWNKPSGVKSKIKKYRFYASRIINLKLAEVLKKHLNKSDYFESSFKPVIPKR